MSQTVTSPFQIDNVRLFIIFRVLFKARFYYPVFSILFLDFGLTLSQFALLNAVWAATIVLCEVPSGALADSFGRRNPGYGGIGLLYALLLTFLRKQASQVEPGLFETALNRSPLDLSEKQTSQR